MYCAEPAGRRFRENGMEAGRGTLRWRHRLAGQGQSTGNATGIELCP